MKRRINKVLLLIAIVAILGFSYSFYEARDIRLVRHTFIHKNIPDAFDGVKLVFITDIHSNSYLSTKELGDIVTRINSLNPDIIVLGGDYTSKDSIYANPFFSEVKRLKSAYGVYSVLGNHDFWEDAELIQQGLIDSGCKICDNQSYWIYKENDSIKIGGVGDLWEDKQIIENTIDGVNKNDFCILLSHNPDYIEKITSDKIDLMLSGHNHGGQVTLFGLYAPVLPSYWRPNLPNMGQKYRYGWKQVNDIQLYISSGIGTGDFPFRFFAPPEIVEITLKKNRVQ